MSSRIAVLALAVTLVTLAPALAQDAGPTPTAPPQKCSAIPMKKFPASPPAATTKQGRFASCMPAKQCSPTDDKAKQALGRSFCVMNYHGTCRTGTCDKPTLSCQAELRMSESKGIKLGNCVSRATKVACPKDGEELCLCDLEIEAEGSVACGCSCQIAPTPTPTAR
jgi:hypothetical protein